MCCLVQRIACVTRVAIAYVGSVRDVDVVGLKGTVSRCLACACVISRRSTHHCEGDRGVFSDWMCVVEDAASAI